MTGNEKFGYLEGNHYLYDIRSDVTQWLKVLPILAQGDAKMYSPVFPLNLLSLRPDILLALQVNLGSGLKWSGSFFKAYQKF